MSELNEVIYMGENDQIVYNRWVEWEHVSTDFGHCPVCVVLDGCWFNNKKKPELPQHKNCHCKANTISKPIANVNAKAECDIKKFNDYIFAEKYAWNGKKDLFERLGFTKSDAEFLKFEYEKQAIKNYCDSKYVLRKLDKEGQRINIDINLEKNGRKIVFISSWW